MGVLGVYCRISNKRDNYSLGEQKRMGIEVCELNGYEYKVYEEVESGIKGKVGRKYFNEMMSLVERGELEGVVIYNVDRFLRDKRVSIEIEDIYEEIDGFELYVDGFKREIGEYEKDKDWWEYEVSRSSNEIRSMRRKFFMGLKKSYRDGISVGGGKKYGYDRVGNKKSEKRLVVNEKEKESIVYLFKLLNSKRKLKNRKHIAELLFDKFGVKFYSAKLKRVIEDETYFSGKWKYKFMDEDYVFEVDSFISEEEWKGGNERFKEIGGKKKGREVVDYLLKDLVYCGSCGEKCYIGGSGKYRYFYCSSHFEKDVFELKERRKECNNFKSGGVNRRVLDDVIWDILFKVLENNNVIKEEYLKKFDKNKGLNEKFKGRLKYGENKLKELEKEESEVLINLGKSGIDKGRLNKIIKEYIDKKIKVEEDIKRYKVENKKYKNKELVGDYIDLMNNDLERRKNVNYKNRKEEIERYIKRICLIRRNENEYDIDLKFRIDINKDEIDKFDNYNIKDKRNNFYIKYNRIYTLNYYIEIVDVNIKCKVLIDKRLKELYKIDSFFNVKNIEIDVM